MAVHEQPPPSNRGVHDDPMLHYVVPIRTYLIVFGILFALFVLTVAAAFVDLGPLNFVFAMTIAITKAVLIILFFMHVRYSSRMTRVFAGAAFLWLALLLAATQADYLTRSWLPVYGDNVGIGADGFDAPPQQNR